MANATDLPDSPGSLDSDASDALAILFANLGGSTCLYDTLGDVRAREMTGEYLDRMLAEVELAGGRVAKTFGDELMCAFDDANGAFDAALGIMRVLENAAPADGMGVHVGFHFGPVIREKDDVFGASVNLAARMVRFARSGEIVTTQQAVDQLSLDRRARTRLIDRSLEGREEKIEVYTVALARDLRLETLNLAALDESSGAETSTVSLRLGDVEVTLDAKRSVATIGRQPDCNLVLKDSGVSRQHARVELRAGKVYLCDMSTNGTVLIANRGDPTFLRCEEAMLQGSGRFGPSPSSNGEPGTRIHFEVTTRLRG